MCFYTLDLYMILYQFIPQWREEMEFFKDLESINTSKMSGLRAGKQAEQAEFETLLREVEKELDQAASQAPRRRSEDEVINSIHHTILSNPVINNFRFFQYFIHDRRAIVFFVDHLLCSAYQPY